MLTNNIKVYKKELKQGLIYYKNVLIHQSE